VDLSWLNRKGHAIDGVQATKVNRNLFHGQMAFFKSSNLLGRCASMRSVGVHRCPVVEWPSEGRGAMVLYRLNTSTYARIIRHHDDRLQPLWRDGEQAVELFW
jgi:hypothetical protein